MYIILPQEDVVQGLSQWQTRWDSFFIHYIVNFLDLEFVFQGNVCFFKRVFLQQVAVDFHGIKSGIARNVLGLIRGCL